MTRDYYPSELADIWQRATEAFGSEVRRMLATRCTLYAISDGVATVAMPRGWHPAFNGTPHGQTLASAISAATGETVRLVFAPPLARMTAGSRIGVGSP